MLPLAIPPETWRLIACLREHFHTTANILDSLTDPPLLHAALLDDGSFAVPVYNLVAAYSPALKAPFCAGRVVSCTSGDLLQGRQGLKGMTKVGHHHASRFPVYTCDHQLQECSPDAIGQTAANCKHVY
jgi:hypothetical protein